MSIRGAGRIARAGAGAIGKFAESYSGNDMAQFRKDLDEAVKILLDSRPTAVSLWNGVHASIKGVEDIDKVDDARELLTRNSNEFIAESNEAVKTIARIGAKRIEDGDTIMTHSNSSVAISVEVVVLPSEPVMAMVLQGQRAKNASISLVTRVCSPSPGVSFIGCKPGVRNTTS